MDAVPAKPSPHDFHTGHEVAGRYGQAQMTTFILGISARSLAEAEIVRWLRPTSGDAVTVDQPMLKVETAKAVVEVPALLSGIVKTLYDSRAMPPRRTPNRF